MLDFGAFVLVVGIVARVTRLITTDLLPFGWLRARLIRRFGEDSLPADGIRCDWCVSIWIAIGTVVVWLFAGHTLAFHFVGLVCLCSYIAGFLNQRT